METNEPNVYPGSVVRGGEVTAPTPKGAIKVREHYVVQRYGPSRPDPDGGHLRLLGAQTVTYVPRREEWERIVESEHAVVENRGAWHYARIYAPDGEAAQ